MVRIGRYVYTAPNVGNISANHNLYDTRDHDVGTVEIGDYSWIGMNAVILPAVKLGPHKLLEQALLLRRVLKKGIVLLLGILQGR